MSARNHLYLNKLANYYSGNSVTAVKIFKQLIGGKVNNCVQKVRLCRRLSVADEPLIVVDTSHRTSDRRSVSSL